MSDFSRTIVGTRTLQMFPVLGPTEIERVRRFGVPHRFDDGSALVLAGAAGHGLAIVLSGEVDVSQLRQSGVREFITTHRPGAFMGELAQLVGPIDPDRLYDAAIVGAGPAGLAAAVYAGSEGLSVLV